MAKYIYRCPVKDCVGVCIKTIIGMFYKRPICPRCKKKMKRGKKL